jgi:outer membrane protein OmpA-like peptidoglycan-associated protein
MSDNKTLIFSSQREGGKGGYDLYESKLRAGKWTNPMPLAFINTSKDDELISVPASGDVIYFSSTTSNSRDDIYELELPNEFRPDKLVLVSGTIRDIETNKIIPAVIKINNIKTKEKVDEVKNNETTGKYKLLLQEGEKYDVSISSKGKTFHSEVIDLENTTKYQLVNKDITLKPLKENVSFVLNNIFFGYDSTNLKKESELELERAIELMKLNPTMNVEISAHTDDKGSDEYNLKLSQQRAKAVVKYLIDHGIPSNRLMSKGYGESNPAFPNDTEENRENNRRVEFKVLKL